MTAPLVLVIDDVPDNVSMLERWLRRRGYDVATAVDGADGVAKARALRPALIITDIAMPVMNGMEATRAVRADPNIATTPVIALTAHAMEADRRACLEAGCDAVATKPVEFQSLLALIVDAIGPGAAAVPTRAH